MGHYIVYIVIPARFQRKTVGSAHSLGHFGMSKTKRMLRDRYWFPKMNDLVEQIVGQCFECQVTTKQHRSELVKMMPIPEKPWKIVAVDFGGPYPDSHYNLVVVDKRTRYPEVETTHSTTVKPTTKKLKQMFATHGTPKQLDSDNGHPLDQKGLQNLLKRRDFVITVLYQNPQEQMVKSKKRQDYEVAVQDILTGYRSTPHPATGIAPYKSENEARLPTRYQ